MNTLPVQSRGGHLFVKLANVLWLLDAGTPASFSAFSAVTFAGEQFHLRKDYLMKAGRIRLDEAPSKELIPRIASGRDCEALQT